MESANFNGYCAHSGEIAAVTRETDVNSKHPCPRCGKPVKFRYRRVFKDGKRSYQWYWPNHVAGYKAGYKG